MKSLTGYLFILSATLFWGISATVAKSLFTREMDPIVLVQMRMTLSCIVMLGVFLLVRRDLLRVRARDLHRFALLGIIGGAITNFSYYYTIKETNVATAILIQFMAPLFVLLYAAFAREEELTVTKVTAGVLSLVGCFFAVAGTDLSMLDISTAGLVTGVTSAVCWAFANVAIRRILHDYSVWTVLVYSFIFASAFWLFFNPPWAVVAAHYSGETWGIFFGVAMISILIPHSLYYSGVQYLTASRAIITGSFEPIVAIMSAYLILGESLAPVQIAGAALVLIAIAALQIGKGHEGTERLKPTRFAEPEKETGRP